MASLRVVLRAHSAQRCVCVGKNASYYQVGVTGIATHARVKRNRLCRGTTNASKLPYLSKPLPLFSRKKKKNDLSYAIRTIFLHACLYCFSYAEDGLLETFTFTRNYSNRLRAPRRATTQVHFAI